MKCILQRFSGNVRRVKDSVADNTVRNSNGEWIYCSKSQWKENNSIPRKQTTVIEITK